MNIVQAGPREIAGRTAQNPRHGNCESHCSESEEPGLRSVPFGSGCRGIASRTAQNSRHREDMNGVQAGPATALAALHRIRGTDVR